MSADEFAVVNGEVRTNLNLQDELEVRPLPGLSDITDVLNQLETVLPEDHPDIINLINAADTLTGGQFSAVRQAPQVPEPLSVVEDPYAIDPHEEAEQFFNQQMQILDKSFDLPVSEPTEIEAPDRFEDQTIESEMIPIETQAQDMLEYQAIDPEMAFEDSLPHEPLMEQETLEGIVQQEDPFAVAVPGFSEQDVMPNEMLPDMGMHGAMAEPVGYDANMAADEINQAIDHVTGQAMPQEMETEPDPFQPQYDPFMAAEYMFDPRYIPGYMVPGSMPFGPDMGPGPMGPMPMPGP